MSNHERYQSALSFAEKKHNGQFRIGGAPYITHPVAVAEYLKEKGFNTDHQIAALFHDLLEDTDATEQELLEHGGNEEIVHVVRLLTKPKDCNMREYVSKIRQNEMAFAVKNADRLHNLRCAHCADESFKRRYLADTKRWYLEFSDEICEAVRCLEQQLESAS